jgi:transcriptional regulator with XRE-family HTH domain
MPKPRKQSEQKNSISSEVIAQRLIKLRKERGLTQAQLADAIGISRNLLSNYELARTRLTDESIILLIEVLKVSADELLGITKTSELNGDVPSVRLVRRIQKISKLPPAEQKALLRTIDTYLKGVES